MAHRRLLFRPRCLLLAISIVFVPTFGLGGVAGYLFRPMSEAVIISLIASYLLTYTLVPTLAQYLFVNRSHGGDEGGEPSPNAIVRPFARFQHALRTSIRKVATHLSRLARASARQTLAFRHRDVMRRGSVLRTSALSWTKFLPNG